MQKPSILWLNLAVLALTPLAAAILVPLYGAIYGFDWFEWAMFAFFMMATGLSITGGYHRLWSHKTYRAHWAIRLFCAFWGAASLQNSILCWASNHRDHHRFVDKNDKDPYSAAKGFWFSHIGWVVRDYPAGRHNPSNVKDLKRDPIVVWQHRHYLALALFINIALPLCLGWLHGKLFGVFLLAGLLRAVLNHHFTFFINSLAHMWGGRPYQDHHSARDNVLLSLITYGEGYHNFHHSFQHDYRNGVCWWHFDPSKWMIRAGSWVGLTSHLKRASRVQVEKARLDMELKNALRRLEKKMEGDTFRQHLESKYQQMIEVLNEWAKVKKEWYRSKKMAFRARFERIELRGRYLEFKDQVKLQRRQWRYLLSQIPEIP